MLCSLQCCRRILTLVWLRGYCLWQIPALVQCLSGRAAGSVTLPEGIEMVMPGDNVTAKFELINPVAMEPGLRFAMREGGRTVGAGVVSKVLD